MKTPLLLLSFTLLIFSCFPRKEPGISISNNCDVDYDSIKVFTSIEKPTLFYNIKANSRVKGKILFDNNKKGDGCYKILVYKEEILKFNDCFGYYTNGASLNYGFEISIESDTLIVKSK
ncbi:hypothetical protein [Xanthomarina sp. F2636L]|uniref:hypothetical protein n=1 Tax=Xanthomarina sp. F2636L TaxID=2996018 RepID=UPI00225E6FE0|nr:hypothetical protein [Xanthomarina sp. F2636L]MCX7551702.1 hypothetical protein [Xanthomarina sp. F2636L]